MKGVFKMKGGIGLVNEIRMGLKVRHARGKELMMAKERRELKQKDKEHRKEMNKRFWIEQTELENKTIEQFEEDQYKAKLAKLQKWRGGIALQSDYQNGLMAELKEKERGRMNRYLKWKLEEEQKHSNRLRIIQMMKLDSEYWFNSENIDKKMDEAVLIPDVVYDKTDYYTRLQEQALLLETYDFNQIDKMMNNDGLI